MQRLAVDERRQHYKSTQGANQGWRRSRLGGHGGSHFYAWWAPRTSAPLKAGTGFGEAPEGAIFLRDIRHHDDHSQAAAHSFYDHNLPVAIPELRGEEYGPAPWTAPQARFAGSRQRVRIPELEAECLEEMGEYGRAAAMYREMGKLKEALACFRSVPDFDAAAALIRDIGEHPAAEAYRWLEKMRAAVAERPGNFNRLMQAPEKKLLEQMLSEALGVARKPAARKAAPKATTRGAAAARKKPGRPPKKRPLS